MYSAVKTATARTPFMKGPARYTMKRCQRGRFTKSRLSPSALVSSLSRSSCSPSSFTYPPSGMSETRQSVSPHLKPKRRRPKPKEKM